MNDINSIKLNPRTIPVNMQKENEWKHRVIIKEKFLRILRELMGKSEA